MSTETATVGLTHWLPALVDALELDPAGAGTRLWDVIAGRSARITLDDDTVIVEGLGAGRMSVRSDDPHARVDGTGVTTSDVVLALLDGRVEVDQVIENGALEIRSSIDDALWMHSVIELLLDGSSRVGELRTLADDFRRRAPSGDRSVLVAWREGARAAEIDTLGRLGLLEDQRVDHDR